MDYDFIIVGGGLVGSSIAYGLSKHSARIAILDEGDRAFRASRGNFGLVWVQGKGWDYPAYAKWSVIAANLWPAFYRELKQLTGIDVQYQRRGGFEFCLSEQEWNALDGIVKNARRHAGSESDCQMLEHAEVKKYIPQISTSVLGASYSSQDGHVNPLYLLRALHQVMDSAGAAYMPNHHVDRIEQIDGEFVVHVNKTRICGNKIVLCAGLDNTRLGRMLNIHLPVKPVRGQLLITERVQPFLEYPTLQVRQTAEGGLQIGDSSEEAGLNDQTSGEVISMLATRAVRIFPMLQHVRLLRAWSALRIISPDGKPVYQQSTDYPGAYGITCHSGVTLAAIHGGPLSEWISGVNVHPLISAFTGDRFHV